MNELKFSWKWKKYELCACPETLARVHEKQSNETIELKTVEDNVAYTVAYWVRNDEGYYLRTVGDRFFTEIKPDDYTKIIKHLKKAQKALDEYFHSHFCRMEREDDER